MVASFIVYVSVTTQLLPVCSVLFYNVFPMSCIWFRCRCPPLPRRLLSGLILYAGESQCSTSAGTRGWCWQCFSLIGCIRLSHAHISSWCKDRERDVHEGAWPLFLWRLFSHNHTEKSCIVSIRFNLRLVQMNYPHQMLSCVEPVLQFWKQWWMCESRDSNTPGLNVQQSSRKQLGCGCCMVASVPWLFFLFSELPVIMYISDSCMW